MEIIEKMIYLLASTVTASYIKLKFMFLYYASINYGDVLLEYNLEWHK